MYKIDTDGKKQEVEDHKTTLELTDRKLPEIKNWQESENLTCQQQ